MERACFSHVVFSSVDHPCWYLAVEEHVVYRVTGLDLDHFREQDSAKCSDGPSPIADPLCSNTYRDGSKVGDE